MITQIILNFVGGILVTIVGWIPGLPAAVLNAAASVAGYMASISAQVDALGVVIPWSAFYAAVLVWLTVFAAAIALWLVRFVISLISGGGGSA